MVVGYMYPCSLLGGWGIRAARPICEDHRVDFDAPRRVSDLHATNPRTYGMASNNNESPLENAAAELVKVALSETGGGKISKEVVTELKALKTELGKLQKQASTDATLQKVEAQVQVLQKEAVKIATAVSAIQASNDRAEKLAKLQVLQWAISNIGDGEITNYRRNSMAIVKDVLFWFMRNQGRYLTLEDDHENKHNYSYQNKPIPKLGDNKQAVESLVNWIHKLTGSKPRIETEKDGRKAIWYS